MSTAPKPNGHALLSPSSAERTTACPGSVVACIGLPDTSSDYADDGSATHEGSAMCLAGGFTADKLLGSTISINGKAFTCDAERVERMQTYIDYVNALGGQLLVEHALAIDSITGEKDAHGTTDALVMLDEELIIVDLKDGMGRVESEGNKQLAIYAKAALEQFSFFDFERVRLVIVQPKLNHISEWSITVAELDAFIDTMRPQFARALALHAGAEATEADFNPGTRQCKFCKAKATCPALRDQMLATVIDDHVELDQPLAPQVATAMQRTTDNAVLGNLLGAVDLIEDWCAAIRARAMAELADGNPVPGFKLVQGRRGHRQWANKEEAEQMLKAMRLKEAQMYDFSLISPTTAEKLAKAGEIGPRQWPKLQDLITQPDGKPTVAPESDKRQALQVSPRAEVFNDLIEA